MAPSENGDDLTPEELSTRFANSIRALSVLEDAQWRALAETFRTCAGLPVRYGTLATLEERLRWALMVWSEELPKEAAALIAAVGMNAAHRSELHGTIDNDRTTSWITSLSASYGDWVSDLLVANFSDNYRNWAHFALRPITVNARDSTATLVELLLHIRDGDVVRLEMPPGSLIRLIRGLARQTANLPDTHLSAVEDQDWDSADSAFQALVSARPNRSKEKNED